MNVKAVQQALRTIGWRIAVDGQAGPETGRAVRAFQLGYALGPALSVDGIAGPKTHEALDICLDRDGRCSPSFRFRDFRSRGLEECADAGDGWIMVHRELVLGLEDYQDMIGRPVKIRYGYRCEKLNACLGGVKNSQHRTGHAADLVEATETPARIKKLKRFSGLGIMPDGKVIHLDVRHVGDNPTGGTVENPSTWNYG